MESLRIEARAEHGGPARPIVDGIDLELHRGEVLGLIGESGAGKSTIGLAALGYTRPGCLITGGRIVFDGLDVRELSLEQRRALRGRRIAYIAQSAAAAFNPAKRIYQQICFGRAAATRHGGHGDVVPARHFDPGRTHHRARRHDTDRGVGRDPQDDPRASYGRSLHHA
jgi:peptide/nickel transport system ATP-binding protein